MWKPSILYCWWKPCDIWQNDSKLEMVCPGTHILSWHKNSSSEALWPDYWCRLVGTSHLNMHSLEKETYEISPSWEKNSTLGNQRCGPALYTCPCSQTKRVAQEKGSGVEFTSSSYSPFLGTSQYPFLVRSFNWSAWNASTDKSSGSEVSAPVPETIRISAFQRVWSSYSIGSRGSSCQCETISVLTSTENWDWSTGCYYVKAWGDCSQY